MHLLDTPGFNIFINDTRAALVAADAALVVVDGVAGVEVQTEKVWSFSEQYGLARAFTHSAQLAMLASVAFVLVALQHGRFCARLSACQSGLRQLAQGATLYATDWDGYWPLPDRNASRSSGLHRIRVQFHSFGLPSQRFHSGQQLFRLRFADAVAFFETIS